MYELAHYLDPWYPEHLKPERFLLVLIGSLLQRATKQIESFDDEELYRWFATQ
jgi:hypothetical protein